MTKEQQQFLTIIGNTVNQNGENIADDDINWKDLFTLAVSQKLLPMVVSGIGNNEKAVATEEFDYYKRMALSSILRQGMKTAAFLKLYQSFKDAGITPIVMKGIICRKMYGKEANLRESCDEDILIQKGDFETAKNILESEGYVCEIPEVSEKKLDELQEISFYNFKNGLSIEVHTNPIGNENDFRVKMNKYFLNCFDKAIFEDIKDSKGNVVSVKTFNETDHFLFLVLHAFKHFTVYGFGIRQCIDIAMFQKNHYANIRWNEIYSKLEEVGALSFLADVQCVCNEYLGFDNMLITSINCPEDLLEDLLVNGIYGNETQAQRTAEGMTTAAVSTEREGSDAFKRWWHTAFPQRSRMVSQYPELVDKGWLLPFTWVKRWCNFLKHRKEYDGDLLAESVKISKRRVALLRKYRVVK